MVSSDRRIISNNSEVRLPASENMTLWSGLKKHLKDYCECSSIQGLNYMVKEGVSWFERFWWLLVFILCIGGCSYMVYEIIDKWVTSPVLVTLATKETPVYEIPFPAVTICPETMISKRCVNYTKILRARKRGVMFTEPIEESIVENMYFDFMSLICKSDNHNGTMELWNTSLSSLFNKSVDNDFLSSLPKLDDYEEFLTECAAFDMDYSACEWMGEEVACKDVLTPIITEEGLCYSFNMFDVRDIYSDTNKMVHPSEGRRNPEWNPDEGYSEGGKNDDDTYPRRVTLSGANNAFTAVFLTKKDEKYFSCKDFALQGIRVSLHMPSRIPQPSQVFFSVGLNRFSNVAVTPALMTTTDKIKNYDPHKRGCYFGTERKLKYFKWYSQSNCNLECFTNYTIRKCGCVNFYMPRDENIGICALSNRSCLEETKVHYPLAMRNGEEETSSCDCLPICTDLTYNAETSTVEWDWANSDTPELDDFREFVEWYQSSAVRIFFKSTFFLPTEKSELYGFTDFVSNTGGILGLFTGFSLFSLAELLYFLSVRVIENYRRYGYWAGPREAENV